MLERILDKEGVEERQLFGDAYQHTLKIKQLQNALRKIEYNPGPIDGSMGDETRSAVKAFQNDYELKASGCVDKKTWVKLNQAYERKVLSFEKINTKKVQAALKNAGFNPGFIDGKLGPKTKRSIREFQKSKGLTQDGSIGFETWKELKEYLLEER